MRLTKAQRATLREKFGGVCAYCGQPLAERWHADHFEPVEREVGYKGNLLGMRYPERNVIGNFMPSCAPCNISKGPLLLDQWRGWLEGHLRSLNAHSTPYRLIKAYGLVVETGEPIIFHFERVAAQAKEQAA